MNLVLSRAKYYCSYFILNPDLPLLLPHVSTDPPKPDPVVINMLIQKDIFRTSALLLDAIKALGSRIKQGSLKSTPNTPAASAASGTGRVPTPEQQQLSQVRHEVAMPCIRCWDRWGGKVLLSNLISWYFKRAVALICFSMFGAFWIPEFKDDASS
jgi:hypothetical protein